MNETLNHLIDAFDEEYITKEQLLNFKNDIEDCTELSNDYITYFEKENE